MSSNSTRVLKLMSSDKQLFEVEEDVAMKSQTFKIMIEDGCVDGVIPIPNIAGPALAKVIEWCKKHVNVVDDDASKDKLKKWESDFVKVDRNTLFDFFMAANYLNVGDMLDRLCREAAARIKGKSPEEIRKIFNIKNDFSPEEEEEIRRENPWAFE